MQKKQVIQALLERLNLRLEQLRKTRADLMESRESDSGKSSAGDKYETGVEMIQQEIEHIQGQIDQAERQKSLLNAISLAPNKYAGEGSLVLTDKATYFIGIPYGELKLETGNVYCISSVSPIGAVMIGKQQGDHLNFRDQSMQIKGIH